MSIRCIVGALMVVMGVAVVTGRQPATGDRLERSLRLPAGERPASLEVDTIWGDIDVLGHAGGTVDVIARRTVRADTEAERTAAEREVQLIVTEGVPHLRLYVDGPFRDCDRQGDRRARSRARDYEVRYDFQVRVPSGVELRLRTIDVGRIRLSGTDGPFDLANVNGGIELSDVEGAGRARTVNGDVRVTYRRNPADAVRLETLNGNIVARFAPGLSADFWVRTADGDVLTDYDVTSLPPPAPTEERKGASRRWRLSPRNGLRVGAGGPAVDLETFHGDIRILRSKS